jgi:ubiquinone biosynthesis protein UbiJ
LAAVPDSAIGEIGMDGRVLRDMAVAELQAKRDLSPLVKEVADLREDKRRLEEVVERLETRLEALEKRRGRPPNPVEEAA